MAKFCTYLAVAAAASLVGAPLASAAPKKHHKATASGATQEQLRALSDQVQALTTKLQQQEQATQAAQARAQQAEAAANEAQASARQVQDQMRAQVDTIPGTVKSAIAEERPLDGKIHLRDNVTVTFGGFAAAESIYRSKNEEADISSSFSKIPFDNNPVGKTSEWRATARQSRISMLVEGQINSDTKAAFYSELDFQGGAQTANSNESNSYNPRIRNVYASLDWNNLSWGGGLHLLAGQNWSLATLNGNGISPRNEVLPPTIDGQYLPGFTWTRQPQFRLAGDFLDKQLWAALSVENPQTILATPATGTNGTAVPGLTVTSTGVSTNGFDTANTLSLNQVPDVIGKVAYEPNIHGSRPLHFEVFGLYRQLYNRVNVTTADNLLGLPVGASNEETDAGGFGGGLTWTAIPKRLDIEGSVLTGKGIGRYGSGQLPDAVVGIDGRLRAIPETMFLGGATLHATPGLDIYVFGGEEHQSRVASVIAGKSFGYGSPFATLDECSVEGGVCAPNIQLISHITAGFWDKIYQGSYGSVRFGVQYSYTELNAFSGQGGVAPKTNDSMVFTSFRYYPF